MEILGEYVRAINRLCEPSRFLARAYRYYRTMRPTRAALARQQGTAAAFLPVPEGG